MQSLWKMIIGYILLGMLWLLGTACIVSSIGCKSGNAAWNVENGHIGTQFEIGWDSKTTLSIGFPGEIVGDAKGSGELKPGEPVPVTPTELKTP